MPKLELLTRRTQPVEIDILPDISLVGAGPITEAFRARGMSSFRAAARHVWCLSYGRTSAHADLRLVLAEGRGTCSSKHALLAALVYEERLEDIELVLGIYEMTEANTPGVDEVLAARGLDALPEAHCWLRYRGVDIDLTMPPGSPSFDGRERRFLHQEAIPPEAAVGAYKAEIHRGVLARWLTSKGRLDLTLNDVWRVREACIAALAAASNASSVSLRQ